MTVSNMVSLSEPLLVNSFFEWRSAARTLLAANVPPHAVNWVESVEKSDLFSDTVNGTKDLPETERVRLQDDATIQEIMGPPIGRSAFQVSRQLMDMLQVASCFCSADRWAFLYKVIWRWQRGEKEVLSAADEDGNRLHAMVKAVHREEHDMRAYVRFRERPDDAGPRFIAWYEPVHNVLQKGARHFAARLGHVTWLIATPDAMAFWDGKTIHITDPLLCGPQEIDDAGESLWLTYYRSIFNPSRLNPHVMHSHIPSRFWKNLPEGKLVPSMIVGASNGAQRVGQVNTLAKRSGAIIPISAERAQPQRAAQTTLDQCRRCELWEKATQPVSGVGAVDARIMLVGEQPGDLEDIAGTPFIGPAGQLLDQALKKAGLARDSLYMTNAVKHFKWEPRGKRRIHKSPAQREIVACRHWLTEELARVRPAVIVAMGSTALKALLGVNQVRLTDLMGKPFQHDGIWIIAVYHPAFVLRAVDQATKQHALDMMVDGFKQAQQLLTANDAPKAAPEILAAE